VFLLVFVVPELRKYIRPDAFNILSHMVFTMTDFLLNRYGWILTLGATALLSGYLYVQTEVGQVRVDRFKLRAPVLGQIFTIVAISRFCRILGTLLANGVPILESLHIAKSSAGNRVLAEEIGRAAESVQKGESLSKPLGKSGYFPPDVIDMMAVAEESNNLDKVLVQIADTQENRTARTIDLAVRLIEPILLLVMAGVVLCIALALLLPILTMNTTGLS
jgi:general secretion pathway protein F/type IV pilus assembly protein PilC